MENLGKLFSRPKCQYVSVELSSAACSLITHPYLQENCSGENITVSPSPYDLLYIGSCRDCVFTVSDQPAKCIMGEDFSSSGRCGGSTTSLLSHDTEQCHEVEINFKKPIISGTLVSETALAL